MHSNQSSITFEPSNRNKMKYTNEQLKEMLSKEIEKCGEYVWSDRRKTIEEMLRMRGVKLN